MFLDFTQLYLEFFATVLGIVILMVVGYLLISRPKKMEEAPIEVKQKKVKEPKPMKSVKEDRKPAKKNISNEVKEQDTEKQDSNTDDLYDSNDDDQKPDQQEYNEKETLKTTVKTQENNPQIAPVLTPSKEVKAEAKADVTIDEKPISDKEHPAKTDTIPTVSKEEIHIGNEDDDEVIDDFEQVDQLIEEQRHMEKPKPVKPIPKVTNPKPKKKKVDLGRYHVLYKKEDNTWYVKREGSDRVVKSLETQREALAFATIKAINQKTTVVVHKRDGKIKKGTL